MKLLKGLLFVSSLIVLQSLNAQVVFNLDAAKRGAEMKYIYKVCQSQYRCRSQKTMGEKIEKLCGAITNLSESFIIKD